MRTGAAVFTAAFAAAIALSACKNDSPSTCFESNATPYAFHLPGDTGAVFRWPAAYMPVRVYAEPAGELVANTQAGLVLWVNATRCGEFSFTMTTDSAQADIIVRNPGSQPPLPAPGFSMGADSVGACFGRTDVITDDSTTQVIEKLRSYVWPNTADPVALASCYHFTVAHELGHAIGLFGHSPNSADIMNVIPRRPVISINDAYAVEILYHRNATLLPPDR